jgi:hypothetical protein
MLWPNSSEHVFPLPRSIDDVLADYVFYPEAEWGTFGYRPPENAPLIGAWRDSEGQVFAFLLDMAASRPAPEERSFLLYVSGERDAVNEVGAKVTALKSVLRNMERRELRTSHANDRIEREKRSPAVARLLKLVGVFTVVVNAFSLYLRRLSPPEFPREWIQGTYLALVTVVHFSALILLLVITLVSIGYALRYGLLMLRRL